MLSIRDIETKDFSRSKNGYKEEEVEAFLDEIIVDYTALLEEKDSLGKRILALTEKLEKIRDEQDERMQSLLNTQKSYDEVMRTAKTNAETLITEAKQKSEETVKEAQEKARYLVKEAETKAKDIVVASETLKAQNNALSEEIERIKTQVNRLCQSYIEEVAELPEVAKLEIQGIPATVEEPVAAPVAEETVAEILEPEEAEEDMFATMVRPVVKETRVADLPSEVTEDKINKALNITTDDDEEDYEASFYSRKRPDRTVSKGKDREDKIRRLFADDDDDDYDDDDDFDEFDEEFEEEEPKKKFSFFGSKNKKNKRRDDDDYDDDDDDFYDDDDDED